METAYRIGHGFDVHAFAEDRKLILGGIEIPFELGLLGHSDADVLLHAIADALLGALALGDIGKHFPDTDEVFKDADSGELLKAVYKIIRSKGYSLGNVDATLLLERPKVRPYIDTIRQRIADLLQCGTDQVSVKATTTEKLGFTGRLEGAAAEAVVIIFKTEN